MKERKKKYIQKKNKQTKTKKNDKRWKRFKDTLAETYDAFLDLISPKAENINNHCMKEQIMECTCFEMLLSIETLDASQILLSDTLDINRKHRAANKIYHPDKQFYKINERKECIDNTNNKYCENNPLYFLNDCQELLVSAFVRHYYRDRIQNILKDYNQCQNDDKFPIKEHRDVICEYNARKSIFNGNQDFISQIKDNEIQQSGQSKKWSYQAIEYFYLFADGSTSMIPHLDKGVCVCVCVFFLFEPKIFRGNI